MGQEQHTSTKDSALAELERWRCVRRWARVDPATLALDEVIAVGPTQVILESVYERRGVRYALRSAARPPAVVQEGPDPWAYDLQHPPGGRLGHEVSLRLPDVSLQLECAVCNTTGETTCARCQGKGSFRTRDRTETCQTCHGRGVVVCDTCGGSGGLVGDPTVWSVLALHREVRSVEAEALPNDVFLALQASAEGGEKGGDASVVIHEQRGERVYALQRSQGYRDDAVHGAEAALHRLVGMLAEAPGVASSDRIHSQRLEVRQVPVYELRVRGHEPVFAYGDPLVVSPPGPLLTVLGKVAHALRWPR